jgi:hypothetical protein
LKFKHIRLLVIDKKSMLVRNSYSMSTRYCRRQDLTKAMDHLVACPLYSWAIGNSCLQFWTARSIRIRLNCKEEQMQLSRRNGRKMQSLLDISLRHRPICSTVNLTRVSSLQRYNNRKETIRQNFAQNSSVLERESLLWQTGIDGSAALLTPFQMLKRLPSLNIGMC